MIPDSDNLDGKHHPKNYLYHEPDRKRLVAPVRRSPVLSCFQYLLICYEMSMNSHFYHSYVYI